jgi:hypothetical protein
MIATNFIIRYGLILLNREEMGTPQYLRVLVSGNEKETWSPMWTTINNFLVCIRFLSGKSLKYESEIK